MVVDMPGFGEQSNKEQNEKSESTCQNGSLCFVVSFGGHYCRFDIFELTW
jgi:hypothetical protein